MVEVKPSVRDDVPRTSLAVLVKDRLEKLVFLSFSKVAEYHVRLLRELDILHRNSLEYVFV